MTSTSATAPAALAKAPPFAQERSAVQSPMRDDAAKLLLRLTVGALMLLHGIAKIQGGIDPIIDAVAKAGLPPLFAYGVFVGQVLAPLMLIVGWWTRTAALVIVFTMMVAVALMHGADLATLSRHGGWALELQAFYLVVALAIALFGPGRLSLDGRRAREQAPAR
jgi:putative oxidoreductase